MDFREVREAVATKPYLRVLRVPGAAAFFVTTAVGRFGVSMYGLSVILAAVAGYSDYVRAGLVGGTFAASEALSGPLLGRLVDRRGQRGILPAVAACHLVAMTALILALHRPVTVGAAAIAAAVAGATVPQLGAFAAARWSHLLHGDQRIETAFSLESLANDVAFIVGPLAASTAVVAIAPPAGASIACALVVTSTVLLALQHSTAPRPGTATAAAATAADAPATRPTRPLIITLGLANVLLGLLFGTTQLAVTALARVNNSVGLSGLYYLTMSLGSLVASAGYGMVRWRTRPWRRFLTAALLITVGAAALAMLRHRVAEFSALFVIGLGVGPVIIITGTLIEKHVAKALLTQTFALMSALSAAGIALAGLAAGTTIEAFGHLGGFMLLTAYGAGLLALSAAVRTSEAKLLVAGAAGPEEPGEQLPVFVPGEGRPGV
jgi:MFS family permease